MPGKKGWKWTCLPRCCVSITAAEHPANANCIKGKKPEVSGWFLSGLKGGMPPYMCKKQGRSYFGILVRQRGHLSSSAWVEQDFSWGQTTQICMLLLIPAHKHRHARRTSTEQLHQFISKNPFHFVLQFICRGCVCVCVCVCAGCKHRHVCKQESEIRWDSSSCGIKAQRTGLYTLPLKKYLFTATPRHVQQS